MPTSVPDTPDFALSDVVAVVNPSKQSLRQCFLDSINALFDRDYEGTYGEDDYHNRLSNFRNYGDVPIHSWSFDMDTNYMEGLTRYYYSASMQQNIVPWSGSQSTEVDGDVDPEGYAPDIEISTAGLSLSVPSDPLDIWSIYRGFFKFDIGNIFQVDDARVVDAEFRIHVKGNWSSYFNAANNYGMDNLKIILCESWDRLIHSSFSDFHRTDEIFKGSRSICHVGDEYYIYFTMLESEKYKLEDRFHSLVDPYFCLAL